MLDEVIESTSSAYTAGVGLRETILSQGLGERQIQLLKNLMHNHPDHVLSAFIKGLVGVGECG
jgi:hypothetical protein